MAAQHEAQEPRKAMEILNLIVDEIMRWDVMIPSGLMILGFSFIRWYLKNRFLAEINKRVEETFTKSITRLKREAELPFDQQIATHHSKLSHVVELHRDRRTFVREYLISLISFKRLLLNPRIFSSGVEAEKFRANIYDSYHILEVNEEMMKLYLRDTQLSESLNKFRLFLIDGLKIRLEATLAIEKIHKEFEIEEERYRNSRAIVKDEQKMTNLDDEFARKMNNFFDTRQKNLENTFNNLKSVESEIHACYSAIVALLRAKVMLYEDERSEEESA